MADNGPPDPGIASAIEHTEGVKPEEIRAGNWLLKERQTSFGKRLIPMVAGFLTGSGLAVFYCTGPLAMWIGSLRRYCYPDCFVHQRIYK
jgi:hypothetical protein